MYLGLDVSTQSTKGLILNPDSGAVEYCHRIDYDRDLPQFGTRMGVIQNVEQKGSSQSDPLMWVAALELLFDHLNQHQPRLLSRVRAISISGQQHGLVCVGREGKLTRPYSRLWNDTCTQTECDELTQKVGGASRVMDKIQNTLRSGYTAGKILSFKKEDPEGFANTQWFLLVHNYINYVLTDGVAHMESGDASGTGLFSPLTRDWDLDLVRAIDPSLVDKLPTVQPSDSLIGKIGSSWTQKFGFAPDCQIAAGSGDNMMGAIGTGNIVGDHRTLTISLGTSGTAFMALPEPYFDPQGEIASFCDATQNYLPLVCVSNLANGYVEMLEAYDIDHQAFDELFEGLPEEEKYSSERMILPWFESERTPDLPRATPLTCGFRAQDFARPEKIAAPLMHGHLLNLLMAVDRLPGPIDQVRLTGGLSQSRAWRQSIAQFLEAPVDVVNGEGAALGAAIHAQWVDQNARQSLKELIARSVRLNSELRSLPNERILDSSRGLKEKFKRFHQSGAKLIRELISQ